MLHAGIIGLPNVGKSTLFNAMTRSDAVSGNYMFSTLEPNVGRVFLNDPRLDVLRDMVQSRKVVPTTVEFIDIPGLVSGSSKGEGIGNQFLSTIREVDAICQVIRCFIDDNVLHVSDSIDPLRDILTIQLELNYADLDSVTKRLGRMEKKIKTAATSDEKLEFETLKKIEEALYNDIPIRLLDLTDDEKRVIKSYNFLSQKPMLYVANVSEEDIIDLDHSELYQQVLNQGLKDKCPVFPISAKLEHELVLLDEEEKVEFMEELGLKESALDGFIRVAYDTLGLETYFTNGVQETRAWTFKKGMTARECAGIIHSDFERGFIRAETVAYDDLLKYGSHQAAKEAGRVRLEGKDYIVKDGDVMLFRFNV